MELWKPLEEWDGNYEVSNIGRIANCKEGDRRILKPKRKAGTSKASCDYLCVTLKKDGKDKNPVVHRLVAKAFVPNPYNKPMVNHKDCNKGNNEASNLEWCTAGENIKHAYDNGMRENNRISAVMVGNKYRHLSIPATRKRCSIPVTLIEIATGEKRKYNPNGKGGVDLVMEIISTLPTKPKSVLDCCVGLGMTVSR